MDRREELATQLADVLNEVWELDGGSILAVEYTRGGPRRIIVGQGSRSVWLLLDEREKRYLVYAEPIVECLDVVDHNGHVWASRDGLRRCPGLRRLPEGGQSLREVRR